MSYYTEVSSSNPQIWWRMNVSGNTIYNSSSDATYSTISGNLSPVNANNAIITGSASFSNLTYFPHADQSGALFQNYYWVGSAPYLTSSFQSILTGVFDMFVTGGNGFTAEWLMKVGWAGTYSNVGSVWAWMNSAGTSGMNFRITGWPEAGTYYFKLYWQNAAASNQNVEIGWGNYPNNAYQQPPKFGLEAYANQGIWGSWGPHNGWHHFVVTMTPFTPGGGSSGYALWIDGISYEIDYVAGTNPQPSGAHNTVTDQKLYVGASPNYTYAYHHISEVAFYNRVLSSSEIISHWASLARWNSHISATLLDPTGSTSLLYSVQAPAGNINAVPASSGTGNDPRATKTNPGAN